VMEIETALAKVSTSRTDMRDPAKRYHIYTLATCRSWLRTSTFPFTSMTLRSPFDTLNVRRRISSRDERADCERTCSVGSPTSGGI